MSDDKVKPVSVILIAYNERATIQADVEGYYRQVVEKVPGSELIVSEDGSGDGTSEILREISGRLPIRLVQGRERKGYIKALFDAMELPRNEWVFFSDTGGKFDPANFWKMQHLRRDFDLIIGIKHNRRDQVYRRLITRGFNLLVRAYFGVGATDIDSGCRIFRKETFLKALYSPPVFRDLISSEMALRMLGLGARLAEVPVSYHLREGKSRGMPPEKIPRVIFNTLRSFPRLRREIVRHPRSQAPGPSRRAPERSS